MGFCVAYELWVPLCQYRAEELRHIVITKPFIRTEITEVSMLFLKVSTVFTLLSDYEVPCIIPQSQFSYRYETTIHTQIHKWGQSLSQRTNSFKFFQKTVVDLLFIVPMLFKLLFFINIYFLEILFIFQELIPLMNFDSLSNISYLLLLYSENDSINMVKIEMN